MVGKINKKAAFLVRCSTNKQDYERQLEDLQLVADRFFFSVSDENIFGEYVTGRDDTTKRDRISIIKLREAASAKKFDVILVAEVSRMSRDSVSGRVYIRQFCNLGIPVYFRDKMKWTIDPETMKEDESFIKELGLYFDGAAEYLRSMKTQIASGRRSSLRNNQLVVGHAPIGYKKRGGKDKRHKNELVRDEEKAQMVKDIFTFYAEDGATLKSVALAISAKYQIKKSVSGVQQILARKEYYTGEYTVYMTDPDNRDKPAEPFTVTFEPIIDKEIYDIASRKRAEQRNKRAPYPKQKIHPLSKLIKCPHCGRSFTPRTRAGDKPGEKYRIINGKKAYAWLCMSRINNSHECLSHVNLNGEKVETIIWEFIKKELLAYADLNRDIREEKILLFKQRMEDAEKQIPLYQQEINKTDSTIKRAYTAYLNAPDSIAEMALQNYNETLMKVKQIRDDYTAEIEKLKDRIKTCNDFINYYSQNNITADYIESIKDNDGERRKLFVQVIEKIVPYGITPGIVVMETHTINGIYYILFNGHNLGKKRIAYYIAAPFAVWHPTNEGELLRNEANSYFTMKNLDIIKVVEGLNPSHVNYATMEKECTANGWVLPYNYIYEKEV
jgi:hypothetical protein